jgi:hypothetical protein
VRLFFSHSSPKLGHWLGLQGGLNFFEYKKCSNIANIFYNRKNLNYMVIYLIWPDNLTDPKKI